MGCVWRINHNKKFPSQCNCFSQQLSRKGPKLLSLNNDWRRARTTVSLPQAQVQAYDLKHTFRRCFRPAGVALKTEKTHWPTNLHLLPSIIQQGNYKT